MTSSLGGALACWRVTQAPHREGCSVQNGGHSRGPHLTCCHQLPRPHAQRRLFVTVRGPRKVLGTGLTALLLRSPHDTETRSLKHRVSVSPRRTLLSVSTAKGSRLSSQVGAASLWSLEGEKDPSPGRPPLARGCVPSKRRKLWAAKTGHLYSLENKTDNGCVCSSVGLGMRGYLGGFSTSFFIFKQFLRSLESEHN